MFDWNLHNMMKFLPLLLIHCANLHNMVKLSLKQFRAGSNRNNPDIVLQNMVKLSKVIKGLPTSSISSQFKSTKSITLRMVKLLIVIILDISNSFHLSNYCLYFQIKVAKLKVDETQISSLGGRGSTGETW